MKVKNFKWMGEQFQFCQVELDSGEKFFGGPYFRGGEDWFSLPNLELCKNSTVVTPLQEEMKVQIAKVAYPTLIQAEENKGKPE